MTIPARTTDARGPRVLAVDGTGLLVRCSRAAARSAPLHSADGTPTGALMMFIGSLARIIRQHPPDMLVVAWDGPRARVWRQRLWPRYKAGRPDAPEGISRETAMAAEFCTAAGIAQISAGGFEADDMLAAITASAARIPGSAVLLCSEDHDMLQLLGPSVTALAPGAGGAFITAGDAEYSWQCAPSLLPRLRALAGDPSDGIPGIPSIGPARAALMIRDCAGQWPPPPELLPSRELDLAGYRADQRDLVVVWERVMNLADPPRRPGDLPGEEAPFGPQWQVADSIPVLGSYAEWDPRAAGNARMVLAKYELTTLSERLSEGRLW